MRTQIFAAAALAGVSLSAQQPAAPGQPQPDPRRPPGAQVMMYAPEQHDLYDGHFILSANRIYMVGNLNDPPGWDHLDNAAATVKPVAGTAEIDVNEIPAGVQARQNPGDLLVAVDLCEFNPCQQGHCRVLAFSGAGTRTGPRHSVISRAGDGRDVEWQAAYGNHFTCDQRHPQSGHDPTTDGSPEAPAEVVRDSGSITIRAAGRKPPNLKCSSTVAWRCK
jgi:hypothetical protein